MLDSTHMSVRYARCPYEMLEDCIPKKGRILDFGCGHGLFANLMAVQSKDREIIGVDPSRYKVETAKKSINGRRNINFIQGGFAEVETKTFTAVTIIDVLYLLSPDNQKNLLRRILFRLEDQGVVVIKEVTASNDFAFKVAYIKEVIMVRILRRTLGNKFFYRTESEWVNLLNEIGYSVKVSRLNTQAPSALFVCKRI